MDWNDEAIGRLRALWDEGHSTAEIGRRLGITKNAVVGKAHRLNLTARPSPIRRNPGEKRAPRSTPRRVSGPTLPVIGAALPVLRATEPPRPQLVLRAVSNPARPMARVTACCWPIGEPGTPTFHFCGDPALTGRPYCPDHASVAYVRVKDRREDAA